MTDVGFILKRMSAHDLEAELLRSFGHTEFRPGQKGVIETLLEGRSALAIFPTGGGKSICYQLPALLMDGLTLVVSPLIALMKDQVDVLRDRGISAARLDSTLSLGELHAVYDGMKSGELRLLYVAPERLSNETFIERLKRCRLAMMAVDEAHCISEWGHNFRPEYLRLAKVAKVLKIPRVLALTATATPEVAEDICRGFEIDGADKIQTPFHRENLHLHITPTPDTERLHRLAEKLSNEKRFPAIVYVTLQDTAEAVAGHLCATGLRAACYHAGLADDVRARCQDDFMSGQMDIIVATIAFGMGIDKANIRSVYHYNLPKTLENYQQETGRAGRDGLDSHCEMLACADDLIVLQNFTYGDTPNEGALLELVEFLLRQNEEFDISRYDLSRSTDIRPLVLETVLTHLEHEEILEPLGAFYASFQIKFKRAQSAILQGHKAERQAFLKALFATGKTGRIWLTLDVEFAAAEIGENRERIMKALNWLEENGEIEMKPSGVRHRYRLLPKASAREPGEVAAWLVDLFLRREKKDMDRLDTVVAMAEHVGCTTRFMLHYFGEELGADCGHCGHCRNPVPQTAARLPQASETRVGDFERRFIQKIKAENHRALQHPRQLTRFLCGITSPATTKDRLTRHRDFGALSRMPFQAVLGSVEPG